MWTLEKKSQDVELFIQGFHHKVNVPETMIDRLLVKKKKDLDWSTSSI